jgi:hypothetical protein
MTINGKKIRRLRGAWNGYRKCLPVNAGPLQIAETKLAFYAGATALLGIMNNEVALMPDDVACTVMKGINDETVEFALEYATTGEVPE